MFFGFSAEKPKNTKVCFVFLPWNQKTFKKTTPDPRNQKNIGKNQKNNKKQKKTIWAKEPQPLKNQKNTGVFWFSVKLRTKKTQNQ